MPAIETTPELVRNVYATLERNLAIVRKRLGRPLTYAENVSARVLILAGANDPRCPIRQIDNYIARLEELRRPHEVFRFDAGHGSLRNEERIRQQEAMIEFVARHMGTTPPL